MRSSFSQRVLALTGAGLLAGVLAVAVAHQNASGANAAAPQPAVGAGSGWTTAIVGVAHAYPAGGKRSSCGWKLERGTLGVVHPVLPCGAKLFLEVGGKRVYTEVVDRAPVPSTEDFDVTAALAEKLGVSGTEAMRWTFARG